MINVKNTTLSDKIQKKRGCARSSCRVYASNLRRINREFSKKKFDFSLKWLKSDATVILNKIKNIKNVNTARNLMSAALIGFDLLNDTENKQKYNTVLKTLNEKKAELQRQGVMTEKQKEAHVPWPRIIKLRRLLNREVRMSKLYKRKPNKTVITKIQRALLLNLYSLLPPTRLDWSDLEIVTQAQFDVIPDKSLKNYLVKARGGYKIYWRSFKTSKHMGEVVVLVKKHSPQLQRLLVTHTRWLLKHFPENKFLLITVTGEKLTRNALTKFLQRTFRAYFKKNISATGLRRSFLTHEFDHSAVQKEEEKHKLMMHSRATAVKDYIRKT